MKQEAPRGQIPGLPFPVSRIFFGTAMPPILTDETEALSLLDSVFVAGVNAFDCARSYGRAENALGKWLKSRGLRNQVVLLTKCGDIREGRVEINRRIIESQMEESLNALQTDCIDLYLLHRDDPTTPVEEYIETLNKARAAGKIKLFGASNWTHQRIAEANHYAQEKGLMGFSVSSPNFGLARQMQDLWGGGCVSLSGPENAEARRWYQANQMPVIAYSSLGRGFFSGRFRAYDYDGARRIMDPYAQKGYLYDENMARLERAEALAQKYDIPVSEIAMRYVFSRGVNVFAVVGTTSSARLQSNLNAAACPLTEAEADFLEGMDE